MVEPAWDASSRRVRRILLIEGLANLAMLVAKAGVGLATGSVAILGDAVHSLADLVNNAIALVVHRISLQPPDRDHPYGHRKFEQLAVFGLATLLAVGAVEIAIRAFDRPSTEVTHSGWALAVMIGVLAVNIAVTTWEARWAERLDSDLLRADARHTLGDVATHVTVITGWQLAARVDPWVDTVIALAVSCFILYLAVSLFRGVVPVLVDEAGADPAELSRVVEAVPGVVAVRRVRSRRIGRRVFADVVVTVDPTLAIVESHAIADRVEGAVERELGIQDTTVHVEPATV